MPTELIIPALIAATAFAMAGASLRAFYCDWIRSIRDAGDE